MLKACYHILSRVYFEDAFIGQALTQELTSSPTAASNRPALTNLCYGVIERDITLDYFLAKLCKAPPKPRIALILKMGLYQLIYTDTPAYAAVNSTVELTKQLNMKQISGFVNAVLKNADSVSFPLDKAGDEYLSVFYGVPKWLLAAIKKDYPTDFRRLLESKTDTNTLTHIRVFKGEDKDAIDLALAPMAASDSPRVRRTPYGYFADSTALDKLSNLRGGFTVQSLGSCVVEHALGVKKGDGVLDACAAPGGKTVFFAQEGAARVIACDIYPHRVELIKKYAARLGLKNVEARLADSSKRAEELVLRFDAVLCDVPCSGSGVFFSKPDILLKGQPDFAALNETQKNILDTCSAYVKPGGTLLYSTCSLLKRENEDIVAAFLKAHPEFRPEKIQSEVPCLEAGAGIQLLPHISGTEGYFAAKLKKSQAEVK